MYEDEKIILARRRAYQKKYTNLDTGIYIQDSFVSFKKIRIFDGLIEIVLPEMYQDMDIEKAKKKYPSEFRPQVIKTNQRQTTDFCFSLIEQNIEKEQLEEVVENFYCALKLMQPMSICFDKGKEMEVNVPYAWMDFTGNSIQGTLYNMLMLYSIKGNLMMFMFSCMFQERAEWKTILEQIRNSVVICEEENNETDKHMDRSR